MTDGETSAPVHPVAASIRGANQKPDNDMAPQKRADLLNAEIMRKWDILTNEDIGLYEKQPEKFFDKIEENYDVGRENAQKQLTRMKAELDSEKVA